MGIPEHELVERATKEDAANYFALRNIQWREEQRERRRQKRKR